QEAECIGPEPSAASSSLRRVSSGSARAPASCAAAASWSAIRSGSCSVSSPPPSVSASSRSGSGAGAEPLLPRPFGSAGAYGVAETHEGQTEQAGIGEEALGQLRVGHREVAETRFPPRLAFPIGQRRRAQPFDEPAQPARGDGLATKVDQVDRDPPLLEESDRGARRLVTLEPEDLDLQTGRRG